MPHPMSASRYARLLSAVLLSAAALLPAAGARAGQYPEHPIRLVIPYAPGGGLTVLGRPLAQKLSEALGQPVIVDTKPGAGTTLGTGIVARAPADGYTLLLTLAAFATGPSVYARLPYDVERDFVPIVPVSASTSILAVHPSVPATDLKELAAYARTKPGGVDYASSGTGGDMHLNIASLLDQAGIPGTHIPFNGGGPASNALMAGQVDVMLVPASFGLPLVLDGRLRPLAVTTAQRWKKDLTQVPTLAELGVADIDVNGWSGIFAPRGTPPEVVARINAEVNRILAEPQFRAFLESVYLTPLGGKPEDFRETVGSDVRKWRQVVQRIGLQPQ